MKKIFLSILFIAAISPVFAQTVKFGITGGLNESIFSLQNNTNNNNSLLAGFHAGIFSNIDFGKLSIVPGLYYTTKGENNNVALVDENAANAGDTFTVKSRLRLSYLELPVNFYYNIPVKGGKFFIGGGPYLAYGLSGKSKTTETIISNGTTTTSYNEFNSTFGSDNGLKRFEFGLGASGGFELKNGLFISVGFEHALTNLEQSGTSNTKNEVFTASLGYSFL